MRATEVQLESLPDVAERVVQSVVSVTSERMADPRNRRGFTFGPPIEQGLGSGVILEDGVVVTNNHVVAGAELVVVTLGDGTEVQAKVVGTDPKSDIAVLRLVDPPEGLVALPYGDSDALRLGEPVLAVGNPFGLGQTVTLGIVSALGRSRGIVDYEDFIQTDAAINPGNSGGALVDLRGRLVGVNTAIVSRSGGSDGVGFAIPEQMVRYVVREILEDGQVDRGFLGVTIQGVPPAMRKTLGVDVPAGGALVSGVAARSPAAQAGFEPGDVIVSFDGEPVREWSRFRNDVAAAGPDRPFAVEVVRAGTKMELRGTLGELPDDEAQRLPIGMHVAPR
jgi:serine protease Do